MKLIENELKRIKKELQKHVDKGTTDSSEYKELYISQQSLSWAINPNLAKSPYNMIMGIQEAQEGYSEPHHQPPS